MYRIDGATDYIEWEVSGVIKSTNRIDDILKLTEKGKARVENINMKVEKDKLYRYRIMFCANDEIDVNICVGIGECIPNCVNYDLPNNLKNGNDMHRCSVRVCSYIPTK